MYYLCYSHGSLIFWSRPDLISHCSRIGLILNFAFLYSRCILIDTYFAHRFFIFLNGALIMWKSKKQPTIKTSVFGAKFMAMTHGMETLHGLRYKLCMMGVPLPGPSYIYGDNMSIIHNTQCPESTLKKKSNEICYHATRESVAMGESRTGHVATAENPADLATK